MKFSELARLVYHFARTRWLLSGRAGFRTRAQLQVWQAKKIASFLKRELPHTPYYQQYVGQQLQQLPLMDKSTSLQHFAQLNSAGISLPTATEAALRSEASRDFKPDLYGYTVGLSSGTMGTRGVFLTSPAESATWAGIIMARTLPSDMLRDLLTGRKQVKIGFFLRANSSLYTTLGSKRIDFRFYDLFQGVDAHLAALEKQAPDILVAPAHVLSHLAQLKLTGMLHIAPRKVISVAEVLEVDDKARIAAAFGGIVHQLYQCTEGFLGYTCEQGVMHLNEEFVHIEPEWLDEEHSRFVPVVTDFTRTTQKIIRYRLNDVLRVRDTPCPCGRVSLALAAVEGRCDDILWLPKKSTTELVAIYPDMLRHAITIFRKALPDYRIEQHGTSLHIAVNDVQPQTRQDMYAAIAALAERLGLQAPDFVHMPFVREDATKKRRRIICVTRPCLVALPKLPVQAEEEDKSNEELSLA